MIGHRAGWARLAPLFSVLCLVSAACSAPGAVSTPPGPSRPAADTRLAAADARFFTGDYDGAEAAYRTLAGAGVALAASHNSTLLAYESRFKESVAQAEAGVAAGSSSASLARLTRAMDWAEDVPGAVRAGAQALAATPVDPLAHIYYSEALADSGRFPEARHQLQLAEAMGGDAYTRAELNREWANYHRGLKDPASELNYIQLSLKIQPEFPERHLELARFQYLAKKQTAAQAVLDKLLAANPQNYPVVVGAANSALIGGDVDRATSLYAAAAQGRPDGADAALGRAEIAVAFKQDFTGAHDLLLETLRKNPKSGPVYRYLRYLDLLVLDRDPSAELDPVTATAPGDLAQSRSEALKRVNGYRSAVGVPALSEDPAIAEGAEAHAYYYLFNFGRPELAGLGVHSEGPQLPGFTGANSLLRSRHFGYTGTRGSEVINHVFTAAASIQIWIDSVFHRYPLLDRETTRAGYGEAQVGILSIAVLDTGAEAPGRGAAVVYPADGQRDVPAAFTGNEIPDPVPAGGAYPVGYPLTYQAGGGQKLSVQVGRLLGPDGQEVPAYTLDPGRQVGNAEWSLLAKQPLTPGATYTAELIGKLDDADLSLRWKFTVAGA